MEPFPTMFRDLPQINIDMDGPLGYDVHDSCTPYHSDTDLPYGVHASLRYGFGTMSKTPCPPLNTQSMSSMDRYLHGPERGPFVADTLSGGFRRHDNVYQPVQQFEFNVPYESQFPDNYGRHASPVSSGSQSSVQSWGAWHSEDLQCSPRIPIHSPSEFSCAVPDIALYRGPGGDLPLSERSCAMADVQLFQDENTALEFDNEVKIEQNQHDLEHIHVRSRGQDDWQDHESIPDVDAGSPHTCTSSHDEAEEDAEYKPNGTATKRRRRRSSQMGSSPPKGAGRRPSHGRKASGNGVLNGNNKIRKPSRRPSKDEIRHFPCPLADYGCQSTFTSKNEWKRHVSTQHLRLGFWRCDLCPDSGSNTGNASHNDFNRKDLFTQHLRRMHTKRSWQNGETRREELSDAQLADHQVRCYKRVRDPPPKSACLFCNRVFAGPGSWDERMEHVGRHLENDRKAGGNKLATAAAKGGWREDEKLRDWFVREGLIEGDGSGGWKVGDGVPRREPQQ